ncbi:hypothetical protein B0E52_12225 [Rhodanobacter sp. C06]|uniref:DUF3667 domain-containing protein n=1 Tax=Rhodanobacter sp. C06 TaxID=1945854 RepID=UPI0009CE3912|nr:DUF3667 domain-containing protein [Rhodanobacter sp. C06]OOG40135.1 hypothetical protein B0E52_12225 [Rhodanobacter sp. C06]
MAGLSGQATACANCAAPLGGEYCAQCGERRLHPDEHTLRHIVGEWFEAFSHGEGRLLVSLRTLLLKPGELTREYFRGRRVPYARPVALFFAVNLLYFLLTTLNTFSTALETQMSVSPLQQTKQMLVLDKALGPQVSATEKAEVMADYWALYGSERAAVLAGRAASAAERKADEEKGVAASRHPAALEAVYRYQERFDERTETLSRALVVALVPMLACLLWLTLAPLRRGLPELLIFATHLWSGLLLILLLFGWLVTGATRVSQWLLDGRIPAILQSDSYASMALAVLVAIYVYRALRAYLCYPRIGCAILSAWMLAGLFWLLQLYRLLLFFVTVYALH